MTTWLRYTFQETNSIYCRLLKSWSNNFDSLKLTEKLLPMLHSDIKESSHRAVIFSEITDYFRVISCIVSERFFIKRFKCIGNISQFDLSVSCQSLFLGILVILSYIIYQALNSHWRLDSRTVEKREKDKRAEGTKPCYSPIGFFNTDCNHDNDVLVNISCPVGASSYPILFQARITSISSSFRFLR